MEIILQHIEGVAKDAILSLKLGDMRRQAPVAKLGQPFRFSANPAQPLPLKVELLAPVAPAETVVLDPLQENIVVRLPGQKQAKLILQQREVPGLRAPPAFTASDVQQVKGLPEDKVKSAKDAAEYMESHDLVRTFQDIIHGLLVTKPSDPFQYLEEHLARAKAIARKDFSGKQAPSAGGASTKKRRSSIEQQGSKVETLMQMLRRGKQNVRLILPFLPEGLQEELTSPEFEQECLADFAQLDTQNLGKLSPEGLLPVICQLSGTKQQSISVEQAEQFFRFFDTDDSGAVDVQEFFSLVQFVIICGFLETTEGGVLQTAVKHEEKRFNEFIQMLADDRERIADIVPYLPDWLVEYLSSDEFFDSCDEQFASLDCDNNGTLEPLELLPVIVNLCESHPLSINEDKCKQFLKLFDSSGDGVIQADEFVAFAQLMMVVNYLDAGPFLDPISTPPPRKRLSLNEGNRTKVDALMDILKRGKANLNLVMPFLPVDLRIWLTSMEFESKCIDDFKTLDTTNIGKLSAKDLLPVIVQLSAENIQSITTVQAEQFLQFFDTNQDGTVSIDEFGALVQFVIIAVYLDTPEGQSLVSELEQEEHHFSEFLKLLEADREAICDVVPLLPEWLIQLVTSPEFVRDCELRFRELDADNSGVLEPDELLPVIAELCGAHPLAIDADKCKRFVKVFDVHGDGVIRFDEFVDFTQYMMTVSFLQTPLDETRNSASKASTPGKKRNDVLIDLLKESKHNIGKVLPFIPEELRTALMDAAFAEEASKQFAAYDKNNDNLLEAEELIPLISELLETQNVTKEQATKFLELFDSDKNGSISLDEFFSLVQFVAILQYLESDDGQALVEVVLDEQQNVNDWLAMMEEGRNRLPDVIPFLPEWLCDYLTSEDFVLECVGGFKDLDADGSGALEPNELYPLIQRLCETHPINIDIDQCKKFAQIFDSNGDGIIQADEFVEFQQYIMVMQYLTEVAASKDAPDDDLASYKAQVEQLTHENQALKQRTQYLEDAVRRIEANLQSSHQL